MSKKNNRKIIARKHAHDLQCEKEAQQKLARKQQKIERKKERQLAATGAVATKQKGLRLRKGAKVKGIKVTDAESKRKVLELLKAEQAAKHMDVDPAAAKADKKLKRRSKLKVARLKAGSSKGSSNNAKAAEPAVSAPMET
eukprot:GHRR01008483.1.p1 GENE.GHRR01008483.1~~GHRR01008483.1.p1  ORF type:complete len:141 (+),score=61.35 GHRR01008483.1:122-544(+)